MYLDFKDERDADFLSAYKKIIISHGKNARYIKKETLLLETIHHPAQRFYVSYEQAHRIITRLWKGQKVTFKNKLKEKMYIDILEKIKQKQSSDLSLKELIAQTIYSPAPRFYITPESASILFYQLIKTKR